MTKSGGSITSEIILRKIESSSNVSEIKSQVDLLLDLARCGEPDLFAAIGALYERGHGDFRPNCTEAVSMYREGIRRGDNVLSRLYLAKCYFYGKCVELDRDKAYQLIRPAAVIEQDPVACLGLGVMLSRGLGCRCDLDEAQSWLWLAWKRGSIIALGHYGYVKRKRGNRLQGWGYSALAFLLALPLIVFDSENPKIRTAY